MGYEHLFRKVKGYPTPGKGILDIGPYLANKDAFQEATIRLAQSCGSVDVTAGIEAYGFALAAAVAAYKGSGFVPLRKNGKLPAHDLKENYSMKYRPANELCCQSDTLRGRSCFLVDDVIDTCGSIEAAIRLLERADAQIAGIGCLIAEQSDRLEALKRKYPITAIYYFHELKDVVTIHQPQS